LWRLPPGSVRAHQGRCGQRRFPPHDLAAWLRRDVDRDAPAESIPLLLDGLAARAASPLNQRSSAAALGYTYDSLALRLVKLVSNFGAIWCPRRDDHGRIVRGSQPKLYLSDPILSWLPSRLHPACGEPAMTMLTETTIGMHLARAINGIDEGRLVVNDTIGYARTGAGNEVDLLPIPISRPAGGTHCPDRRQMGRRPLANRRPSDRSQIWQRHPRHQVDPQHRPPHLGSSSAPPRPPAPVVGESASSERVGSSRTRADASL
jgi:hypothetical protein